MTVNIFVLTASGRLGKYKNKIIKAAKESVKAIGKKIQLPDADVVFYDNPKNIIQHLGVGGYAQTPELVLISLNPKSNNFEKTINEEVIRTLAHELHHCMHIKAVGYGNTLLEAMITEGLADHFELEITNKKPQAWDTALIAKRFGVMKKRAKKEYNNKDYNHNDWFFGSKVRKIQDGRATQSASILSANT